MDALAVTRAMQINLKRGELHQGASTITQQLARTLFLDTHRTWSRKARETAIALMLEVRYSKSRILETYLNSVYLGQDGDVPVYGLPAAARRFLAFLSSPEAMAVFKRFHFVIPSVSEGPSGRVARRLLPRSLATLGMTWRQPPPASSKTAGMTSRRPARAQW